MCSRLHGRLNTLRIASGKPDPDGACIGTFVKLGGKEMEVDCSVSKADFQSGRVFGKGAFGVQTAEDISVSHNIAPTLKKRFVAPLKPVSTNVAQRSRLKEVEEAIENAKDSNAVELEAYQEKSPVIAISAPADSNNASKYWSAHWFVMLIMPTTLVPFHLFFHRRKPQQKKHKTWDGDCFIVMAGSKLTMISDDGKL